MGPHVYQGRASDLRQNTNVASMVPWSEAVVRAHRVYTACVAPRMTERPVHGAARKIRTNVALRLASVSLMPPAVTATS